VTQLMPKVAVREAAQPEQIDPKLELERLYAMKSQVVPIVKGRPEAATLEHYQRLARMYLLADMVPYSVTAKRTPEQQLASTTVILMNGDALGLTHIQALGNMQVVNNRVSLWGDVVPALIRARGYGPIEERIVGDGDAMTAVCSMTRGNETITRTFSVADARMAKLWGKKGYNGSDTPWITHPKRMLAMRARAFAARDGFADVLMGLGMVEELDPDAIPPNLSAVREAVASLPPAPRVPSTEAPAPAAVPEQPHEPAQAAADEPAQPEAAPAPTTQQDEPTDEQRGFLASLQPEPEKVAKRGTPRK